jgi:hypothetical protein
MVDRATNSDFYAARSTELVHFETITSVVYADIWVADLKKRQKILIT